MLLPRRGIVRVQAHVKHATISALPLGNTHPPRNALRGGNLQKLEVPAPGHDVILRLRGSQQQYTVTGRLNSTSVDKASVTLEDGRVLHIPFSAVLSMHVASQPPAPPLHTATASRPALTNIAGILDLLEKRTGRLQPDFLRKVNEALLSLEHESGGALSPQVNSLRTTVELMLRRRQTQGVERSWPLRSELERHISDHQGQRPNLTPGSIEARIQAIMQSLAEADETAWTKFAMRYEPQPRIVVKHTVHVTVEAGGEFVLPIRVALDRASVPARQLAVRIDRCRGLSVIGTSPVLDELRPGDTSVIEIRMKDKRRQGARGQLKVTAHLIYQGVVADALETPTQDLAVHIRTPEVHKPIPNPFRDYAGGVPVDDARMFFGRDGLVDKITDLLSEPTSGRCFALYGQKRTGKTSLMEQVKRQLVERGVIVADVSMGTIDRHDITASFIAEVLDEYRLQVGEKLRADVFENLLTRWPSQSEVQRTPLRSFRLAVRAAKGLLIQSGMDTPKFAIVADEFTYLYEILRRPRVQVSENNQLRDFMRQWKGLLEARLFSALLVGQDTMPNFLRAFPNEFSVMRTSRLDYLTHEETMKLAELPTLHEDGSSRFNGYSLSYVPSYTDGHPFFTQILCDRLITIANAENRVDFAESDIERAVESLIEGPRALDYHIFDCLLSADNTGVLLDDLRDEFSSPDEDEVSDTSFEVLRRMAAVSGGQNTPVPVDDLALSHDQERAYKDLCVRHVVNEKDGRAQIRVLLFAEYLRRNCS